MGRAPPLTQVIIIRPNRLNWKAGLEMPCSELNNSYGGDEKRKHRWDASKGRLTDFGRHDALSSVLCIEDGSRYWPREIYKSPLPVFQFGLKSKQLSSLNSLSRLSSLSIIRHFLPHQIKPLCYSKYNSQTHWKCSSSTPSSLSWLLPSSWLLPRPLHLLNVTSKLEGARMDLMSAVYVISSRFILSPPNRSDRNAMARHAKSLASTCKCPLTN